MDLVFKTVMLSQGGRNGSVQSDDGSFKLKLALPREMGGKTEGVNPEQLFAGAFAACFEHAVRHIARKNHTALRGCFVEAELGLYISFDDVYRMVLTLTVHMAGPLSQDDADFLLERAREVCPMAGATKGNLTLNLKAVLDTPVAA